MIAQQRNRIAFDKAAQAGWSRFVVYVDPQKGQLA
jgi:hypothetical protein